MELYWNDKHTCYAVLVSSGYGAGWSSWNQPELAYDKRVVEYYMTHSPLMSREEVEAAMKQFGYEDVYAGGWHKIHVEWVAANAIWRVDEYDGAEGIEYLNLENWNQFS